MIRTIPLNKLLPSPRNVRRTSDEQADLQLKADIEARGLLQNLVVAAAPRPRASFTVEAGGRRLRALQALVGEGKLARTHEVCCLVLEGDSTQAQETSLAENFQRLSMNPADECLAFQQLIEQGCDVEVIARRFGLTVRFVEGRLRLATLTPVVFEALGTGEISLDLAKAYAVTTDQNRQAYVFEQMTQGYGAASPDSIRRMMTQSSASASDRRARLVGEDVYLAAGGRIEADLFADDAATRWLDVDILERLACEKMATLAAEAAATTGLGWVRPTLDHWLCGAQTAGLRRLALQTPPLTDEEQAAVDALEAEIEEIAASLANEELGDAARSAAEARMIELGSGIDAIVNKPPVIDETLKPQAGAFLMLDEHGRPRLDRGIYVVIADDGESEDHEVDGVSAPGAGKKDRSAGLSQRLVDELAMQRRDILAVHVAADPALALDLAIFLMIDHEAGYSFEKSGSSLVAVPPFNPVPDFGTPEAAASIARANAGQALDRTWTDGVTRAERFDAFRMLPGEARSAWLGHAIARTLEASLNHPGQRACPFHDHLGRLLGIEVARWWRPTGANYFDRVPKAMALAALVEVGGPDFAARYAGSKKAGLAQSCERIFAGDLIAEVEIKQAALAWLPDPMRFASPASAAEPEEPAVAGTDDGGQADREDVGTAAEPMERAA